MSRSALRPRAYYRLWHAIDLRFADNDAFGHVNNTVYYAWFDTALNCFLLEAGLYRIDDSDEIALIVDSSCRYARALRYPGTVEIGLSLDRFGTSSLSWHLGAFAPGAPQAAAEGSLVQVCVSRRDDRPIPIPALWRTVIADRALRPDGVL